MDYERYSRPYKPKSIKVLFIGESPPYIEDGEPVRYFYNEEDESWSLAKSIAPLFKVNTIKPGWKQEFLRTFMDHGYFLVDLSKEPINHISRKDRRACRRQNALDLAREVKVLHPGKVIILMMSLDKILRPLIETPELLCQSVYFPMRWGTESLENALK
jgi:hypothetical protein